MRETCHDVPQGKARPDDIASAANYRHQTGSTSSRTNDPTSMTRGHHGG